MLAAAGLGFDAGAGAAGAGAACAAAALDGGPPSVTEAGPEPEPAGPLVMPLIL